MNEKAQEVSASPQKVLKVSHRTLSQASLQAPDFSADSGDALKRSVSRKTSAEPGHSGSSGSHSHARSASAAVTRATDDADDAELSPTDSKRSQCGRSPPHSVCVLCLAPLPP